MGEVADFVSRAKLLPSVADLWVHRAHFFIWMLSSRVARCLPYHYDYYIIVHARHIVTQLS